MSGLLDPNAGLMQGYTPSNMPGQLQDPRRGAMGTPIMDTGTNGLSYQQVQQNEQLGQLNSQLLQNKLASAQQSSPIAFHAGTMSGGALYAPTADAGLSGQLGPMIRDANGQTLQTPDALANTAGEARASQGLNPGQSNDAQLKSDAMSKLMSSVASLPKEDQHTAYERAIGVLAGQGKVEIHDLPSWENGGRDFMMKMASLQNQGQISVANVQAQNALQNTALQGQNQAQVASINQQPNLIKSQIAQQQMQGQPQGGSGVQNQLQNVISSPLATPADKASAIKSLTELGMTGAAGSGLPVGAPVSARAATTFVSSNQGLSQVQEMAKLLQSGTVNPAVAMAAEKIPGGNTMLSPEDQRFNSLRLGLNSALNNVKGDPSISHDMLDNLSKRIPTVGDSKSEVASKLNDLQSHFTDLKTSLDPDGHIQRAISQNQAPQAPAVPAHFEAAAPGLTSQQAMAIMQMRQQAQAPQQQPQQMPPQQGPAPMPLQPGDRMDYYR